MASARFQIVSPSSRAKTVDDRPNPSVIWRFMSGNNRNLGHAVRDFPDVDSCVAEVRELRHGVTAAACVIIRADERNWAWRVRVDDVDYAESSRRYNRRIQAEHACASFVRQVVTAAGIYLIQRRDLYAELDEVVSQGS
ncbi:MAG TPA: hypothetical protein VGM75_36690 [Pseudonocardiaceae bacterium]